jgi:FdhD protein
MTVPADRSVPVRVTRFDENGSAAVEVQVIREIPLTIIYNGREIITLLATPDHLDELAAGFLRSEGFLQEREDLVDLDIDEALGVARVQGRADAALVERLLEKRTVTSGCGKGTTFYHALDALSAAPAPAGFSIPLARVVELTAEINRLAATGKVAGGVHHAALAGAEEITVLREDIGRHNAIDKIQGHCLLHALPTAERFLMSTGRISSEILIKAAKLGVPLLVSLSKPSQLALELAERLRITVVGDLRGRHGFVYRDFGHLS